MENDLRRAGALHLKLPAASKNPVVMYRNVARLEQIINAYNVDIVHVRSRAPAWSAKKACERTGRHFILGGLLLDAATKDQRFAAIVTELTHRISRAQDRKPFEGRTDRK